MRNLKDYNQKYYLKHKEKILQNRKESGDTERFKKKHPNYHSDYNKKWEELNSKERKEYRKNYRKKHSNSIKEWNRKYYLANREKCLKYNNQWYKENAEKSKKARYKRDQRNKEKALRIICKGKKPYCNKHNKWNCCGNPENIKYLTVDHINSNGTKHRKKIGWGYKLHKWIIENPENARKQLQCLCMNAQFIKRIKEKEWFKT